MYKEKEIFEHIHIMNKLINIIIMLFAIIIIKNIWFLIVSGLLLLFIGRRTRYIFNISVAAIFMGIIALFLPQLLWITKVLIYIAYLSIIISGISINQVRYMLERSFYKYQTRRVTYSILYIIYFFEYIVKNIEELIYIKNSYGVEGNIKFIYYLIKKAYLRTKYQVSDLLVTNQLRFFNIKKSKTHMEKASWGNINNIYIFFHIIVLVLIIRYGR